MMRTCYRCGLELLLETSFYRNRSEPSGYAHACKKCSVAAVILSRKKNPESSRRSSSRYYYRHREACIAASTKTKKENPEKHRSQQREFRIKNPDKIRGYQKKHKNKKYSESPEYRLQCVCRSRIRVALLRQGLKKNSKTSRMLGCSFSDFRTHIEALFREGMRWENYGQIWEVDHIRPCASFDFRDAAQLKQCFHWSNHQPLFCEENQKKGAKWLL